MAFSLPAVPTFPGACDWQQAAYANGFRCDWCSNFLYYADVARDGFPGTRCPSYVPKRDRDTDPLVGTVSVPLCDRCGAELSETLDAYYGRDPDLEGLCQPCRDDLIT